MSEGSNVIASATAQLFMDRLDRLDDERKAIGDDMKDVRAEIKGQGFNPKMIDYARKMRRMEREKRDALLAEQEVYLAAAGLI